MDQRQTVFHLLSPNTSGRALAFLTTDPDIVLIIYDEYKKQERRIYPSKLKGGKLCKLLQCLEYEKSIGSNGLPNYIQQLQH